MRILFTTQPGTGHFNPLAPFARALAVAGHDVAVACAQSFRADVEDAGFQSFPAGLDFRLERLSEFFPNAPTAGPDRMPWIIRHWTNTTARAMAHDLQALADDWRPDLLVREPNEFGACLVAELRGIPHATAGAFWPRPPGPFVASYDPLRLELGLAPDPTMDLLYRYLLLAPMPPRWIAQDEQAPTTIHFVRPELPGIGHEAGLDPQTGQAASRRPLVHATLGTTEANRTPGIYEAIISGLREEPIDLLVAVGGTRDPAELGPQPENVRIEGNVSHAELLPTCDVVVTHGGFGTIMGCLSAGVPMVVLPIQGDQPRNARRCIDLGVGRAVYPGERTPAAIRAAVRAVLVDPAYKANAVRMQREIRALPGPDHAVALLERLARDGEPLRSIKAGA